MLDGRYRNTYSVGSAKSGTSAGGAKIEVAGGGGAGAAPLISSASYHANWLKFYIL